MKIDVIDHDAYTIDEFCEAHRISRWMYYQMRRAGTGPEENRPGKRRVIITKEAATRWRAANPQRRVA